MKTITDEEAFALGVRAAEAGLRIVPGMKTLHARAKWSGGVVTGLDYDGSPAISTGLGDPFSPPNLTADLRDPGTKGHAVAQLRERLQDPVLGPYWRTFPEGWSTAATVDSAYPTEEEAIVAAFEATKETP